MTKPRHQIIPAVYLLFLDGQKILLLRRFQTGWRDGEYSLPSGHLEGNESVMQAGVREAAEEVGVKIKVKDLEFVHVVNRQAQEGGHERVDFFFEIKKYQGKLINNEPHKCDDIRWFNINHPPANTVPLVKHVLDEITRSHYYSECDW